MKKEAKTRIKAQEKRDSDKDKTDEAKNTYESLIYEFRSWLTDDENQVYVKSKDQENYVAKCNEGEDWLYDEGAEAGYKEYQTKTYDLQGSYNKLRNRKTQHTARTQLTGDMTETLTKMRDLLPDILAKKPWISEDEGQDVANKIEDTLTWLDEKMTAQEEAGLLSEPVLTSGDMTTKLTKVQKLFKKITDKKKPKVKE